MKDITNLPSDIPVAVKIAKKDIEAFRKYFLELIKDFGLVDWTITFAVRNDDAFASVEYDVDARQCIVYCSDTTYKTNSFTETFNYKELALHEALHLLLAEYDELALNRFTTRKELCNAQEKIVRVLTSVFNRTRRGK